MNSAHLSKLSNIYVVLLIETEEKAPVQVRRKLRKHKCRQLQFFQPLLLDLKSLFVWILNLTKLAKISSIVSNCYKQMSAWRAFRPF